MTEEEKFLYDFYAIVERIDENNYMRTDFIRYMSEICRLFKKHGICKNKEGKEDE